MITGILNVYHIKVAQARPQYLSLTFDHYKLVKGLGCYLFNREVAFWCLSTKKCSGVAHISYKEFILEYKSQHCCSTTTDLVL